MSNQKHKAVVLLTIEVHPVNEHNECTGEVVSLQTLKDSNLHKYITLDIDGVNLDDCLVKLQRKINEFKSRI